MVVIALTIALIATAYLLKRLGRNVEDTTDESMAGKSKHQGWQTLDLTEPWNRR